MKFRDGLRMALSDLSRRKGRTFLTSLAVAVGTMLIVTLVSLGTSGENMILSKTQDSSQLKMAQVSNMKYFDINTADTSDLNQSDMFKKIDNNTLKKLKAISGVHEMLASINLNISNFKIDNFENKNSTLVTGLYNNTSVFTSESIASVRKDNNNNNLKPIIAGRNLNSSDKASVIVGQDFLSAMGIKDYASVVGKNLILTETQTSEANITLPPLTVTCKIVGIIGSKFEDGNPVVTSIDTANKLMSYSNLEDDYLSSEGYPSVVIMGNNMNDMSHIGASIKNLGYFYITYEDEINIVKNVFNIINAILAVLGIVVLFVAAVGIVNTMIMVIYERTKSIGIMKSIGASRSNIHSIFLYHSGLIGFIGGVMGLIFSFINIKIIEFALKAYLQSKKITEVVTFTMPSWLVIGTLIFSILISVIAGLYPAIRASKMDPIKALNS